jgi:hypothetical protein
MKGVSGRCRTWPAGGSNDLDVVKLDYFIARARGSYERPYNHIPIWTNSAPTTITYNNYNSNFPSVAVTGGANPYDFSGYTLTSFSDSPQENVTRDWQGKLNAAFPTHWTGYPTEELKFAVGVRLRKFEQNASLYSATSVPPIPLSRQIRNFRRITGRIDQGEL